MSSDGDNNNISTPVAVASCVAMALSYVLILYAPTVILRLPSPSSFSHFMIRRFICAAISTTASLLFTAFILLPIKSWEASVILGAFGIRKDHLWQGVVYPLLLTSLIYAGSLVLNLVSLIESCKESGGGFSKVLTFVQAIPACILMCASDVSFLRNLVVAPLTEELVFRACMVPLLLCAGFRSYSAIFLCPILFSLAHLNHFRETYIRHNRSYIKASLIVGLQLGYTVVFGAFASFLFIRTGHLAAPLFAHIFCNYMGLPVVIHSRGKGLVSLAALVGVIGFVTLLFPLTEPLMYNDRTNNCPCWLAYCLWN
ncbi:CAAX prenyl protease 2 [Raphanus sativus]|uniref:intramembrane prenyl-peptidase Rce1 n=1 Tax=Raphanus sativus TaxID=3726 RepID=A0A9W3CVQ5_RAPSA|nr:CAAX prenyl protease 2-like [Raphanus sativus]KAJ4868508.1 CAAX prenyl protease 2 [Raphanus sativus]